MGILNVTPDSFSDGGTYFDHSAALTHALQMVEDGADIIDIGGESTRPPGKAYGEGAKLVSAEEEFKRVIPIVIALRHSSDAMISVDTQKASIADAALLCGANIINDVSAGTTDRDMFAVAAKHNVPIVLMHGHGPRFEEKPVDEYVYQDVVREVQSYLKERIQAARLAGISTILADVGVGFAKAFEDNLRLLKDHAAFTTLGVPMVLGVSRKSTIGRAMGGNRPPKERIVGSVAAACYGALHGARIIRTHDVKETRDAVSVLEAITQA